jgi:hypothetical protein
MSIRKFGTSDDQKVVVDKDDEQSLQKNASIVWGGEGAVPWNERDERELAEENKE